MTKQKLRIGYLYSDLMNIYGDTGNIICLTKRCEWRGIDVEVKEISIGNKLVKGECDIFFFGGGQDQAQNDVAKDLKSKSAVLKTELERGVPMLSICGGYQLLGDYYEPQEGPKLEGLGFLPVFTKASDERMIGNLVISSEFMVHGKKQNQKAMNNEPITNNQLVGFENHSGKTFLKDGAKPLGKVIKGFGNNGEDNSEGCIYKNSIGCYMHGSLLPKNPELADWLIEKALEVKYGKKEVEFKKLEDVLENKAHDFAIKKFG